MGPLGYEMSDTTQRRGTDYDSLRNLGAGVSRSPREAEDPLAELARLVSQSDPYAVPEEPRSPSYASAPRAYSPPVVDQDDRLDPIAPAASRQADLDPRALDPRAYGAASYPDYDPNDFFADPAAAQPQGYGAVYRDEFAEDDFAAHPHAAYQDDFDDPAAAYGYDEGFAEHDLPVRSRRGMVLAAVAGLVLFGGVGAWATGMFGGEDVADGAPPVIKAESEPVKVVAEAKPVVQQKQSYDRIPVNADANVVPSAEEPGEKPAPRVILPGVSSAPAESRVAETAALPPDSPGQAGDPNGGRRVKTISIRPDGSFAPPSEAPAAAQQPPAPIEGTGVAAGMSMQPGNEFGIMASETDQPSAGPRQATGPSVPMPEPRPAAIAQGFAPEAAPAAPAAVAPQVRASAPEPAPPQQSHGGQPWSPQPQVQIMNKRPLRPSGTPGPSSQAAPSAPPAATPSPPRQVAAAAPTSLSSAPAPAPVQSRPAAPQIAAVSASSAGGFGVQLTAQRSEAEALAAFNALKQRHPNVLGSYSPVIARADLGADRGVFYRAMVPASSQSDASNLCIQFKASGIDCIVQRR